MLRRVLRDLTLSDMTFGGGPLLLAVWFFIRAAMVDNSFNRWAWFLCAVTMLVVCAAYLTWVYHRRHDLRQSQTTEAASPTTESRSQAADS